MNTNPTLSELIASFTATLGRVETILDRAEARERRIDELIEEFTAVFDDEDEADIQWAPADPAPGHPELPLAVQMGTQTGKTQLVSEWAEHQSLIEQLAKHGFNASPASTIEGMRMKLAQIEENAPSIAACTPKVQLNQLPTVTGEGPAVELAMPRKNPSGPDRIAVTELDPTMRDLPMGTDWPELPPLPEGKTRWVNRGDFRNVKAVRQPGGRDHIKYFDGDEWCNTREFSGPFIHIEAI